jgi:hypothetical protein
LLRITGHCRIEQPRHDQFIDQRNFLGLDAKDDAAITLPLPMPPDALCACHGVL